MNKAQKSLLVKAVLAIVAVFVLFLFVFSNLTITATTGKLVTDLAKAATDIVTFLDTNQLLLIITAVLVFLYFMFFRKKGRK